MRITDNRYSGEQAQFQLAIRMIRHEARTRTIRECTGLSDDRIRKIYSTYFQQSLGNKVQRRRGKSPRQIQRFVKSPEHCLQASTLAALLVIGEIVRIDAQNRALRCWPRPDIELGHRMCRAFETYVQIHVRPKFNLEWTWNLYFWLSQNNDLKLANCRFCTRLFLADSYALHREECPGCTLRDLAAP